MKKTLLSAVALLCLLLPGHTQFVDLGQDPARLRWKQITTDNFQIIYPDYFEEKAQKIANIYQALYNHSNSLNHKPKKISTVIHAAGGIANGNVAWAPSKTDLYTTPPQTPGDDWLEHLCIHEFRHVVQIDKLNQGLTKLLYYIFGEQATIAVTGLYVPMWFIEGDAVAYETALGKTGRGRSPEFLNQIKAQIVEKGPYSYYKAAMGSNRDFVPNRYVLGYFLVANARAEYGNNIWNNALDRTGRSPLSITPFARSLKKNFQSVAINPEKQPKGDGKKILYREQFTRLQKQWSQEKKTASRFDTLPTRNKTYTNYHYPTADANGNTIAYKEGLRESGAFVRLRGGKEKLLTRTGTLDDHKFARTGQTLFWSEYRPHPRWAHGGRMVLASYDLKTRTYKRYKARYNRFAPFAVGENLGFIESDPANRSFIVITDKQLQRELHRIPAGPDETFIHPSAHGDTILVAVQHPDGMSLENITLPDGKRKPLSEKEPYELDNPAGTGNSLLFRASYNGNNALYQRDTRTGNISSILQAPFGIRYPAVSGDSLRFSFYTSDGYKPGKIHLQELQKSPLQKSGFPLADTLKARENGPFPPYGDSVFTSKRYRKIGHALNIHSWGPLYVDASAITAEAGLVLYSQNKLSTLSLAAGYIIDNSNYNFGAWMLNITYKGMWPILSVDAKTGKYDYYAFRFEAQNNQTGTTDSLYVKFRSDYSNADITLQFPFDISRKNYRRSISPYLRYQTEAIHHNKIRETYRISIRNNTGYLQPVDPSPYRFDRSANYYQMLEYGLLFSNQARMTAQEIRPRWGQVLQGGYTHTPWKKIDYGHQWWAEGTFYFPGLAANHSISAYAGHQDRPHTQYGKQIRNPRGTELYGTKLTTIQTNYELPLCFPDLAISNLFYFKRLDAGLFFDTGYSKNTLGTDRFHSYGLELTTTLHFLHIPFPLHTGLRYGYETQTKSMFADLLFSVTLNF